MRIRIRTKLAAALALPLVALVGVAGYEVARADRQAGEAADEAALATAAVGPGSLISRLQDERNFSGVDQLGLNGALELPVSSYEQARGNTDESYESLQAFVAERGNEVSSAFQAGLDLVESDLLALRAEIDASPATRGLANADFANEVFDRYTAMISVLLDDTAGVALSVDDAELRTGVELVDLATRAYEIRAQIVRGILLPTLTGDTTTAARTNVSALMSTSAGIDEALLARSTGAYEGLPEVAVGSPREVGQTRLFEHYVNTGVADVAAIAAQVSSTGETGYVAMRARVADALQSTANGLLADASDQRQYVFSVAGLAVALALFVTLLASRSITAPLLSLTRQAEQMASERLPTAVQTVLNTPLGEDVTVPEVDPIAVKTRDEVADVAAALNVVQGSALDLAVEQAVLRRNIADSFVNLGRRNQNLLDRQLDFITDLERQEQDSERLEGLFRLDHLATRMRRNAESLLRLAGGGESGGDGWSGPVPMVDVVRGALGEVEDYQRVDVRALEPAIVAGSTGADLAHAVAELVENALAFSPPQERVEIRGRRSDDGGYVLAVIDQGVGMNQEQLEIANRRLAGQESFTVAPSRYLGHYVAGHLATTHGIKIELQAAPAGGITARLDIPASILTADGGMPRPATTAAPDSPPPAAAVPVPAPMPTSGPVFAAGPMASPADASPVAPIEPAPAPLAPTVTASPAEPMEPVEPVALPPAGERPALPQRSLEPVAAVAPVDSPSSFGGLASRRADDSANGNMTAGGLTRRIRGAQVPSTSVFTPIAFKEPETATSHVAEPVAPTPADDFSAFLSAYSGGVERGLAESKIEEDLL